MTEIEALQLIARCLKAICFVIIYAGTVISIVITIKR